MLPPGDYGLYFTLLGLGMLLQIIADFGLQLYNSRTISGHRQLLAKYFPYFIGLKLLLGLVFYVVLLVAGWVLGYRGWAISLLLLTGTAQLLNSFVLYLRSNLAGLGRYTLDSWFSILDKALMIAFIGGLLLFAPERLTVIVWAGAQVGSWVVTAALLLTVLGGRIPRKLPRFRRSTFLLLLRGGAPYALAVFLQTAYTRIDALMIERLLARGAEAADHYAAGYRLLDAMNMVGWLLAGLLLPMYARLYVRSKGQRSKTSGGEFTQDGPTSTDPEPTNLLRFSTHLLVATGLIAGITVAAESDQIVYLLYDFAEPRTGWILFFLALTFGFQCLNYAYGALLGATGFIGRMNYVFVGGILLNVVGNLWALPRYGAAGAAAVTLATQAFVAVAQAMLAHRWLRMPLGVIGWWRLLVLGIGVGTVALGPWGYAYNWLLQLGIPVLVGGMLATLLSLISPREVLSFLARRGD